MRLNHSRLWTTPVLVFLFAASAISLYGQELTLRRSGFIGVAVGAVPDEMRNRLHLTGGVVIQRLVEGGTAQRARRVCHRRARRD